MKHGAKMSNELTNIEVIKLTLGAASVVTGFAGAWFGAVLALRKNKQEKVWDEKRELYSRVIVASEDILYWAEQVRAERCGEYTNSIDSNVNESFREIEKSAVTGRLVMNDRFYGVLKSLNDKLQVENFRSHEDYLESMDNPSSDHRFRHALNIRDIVSNHLESLIDAAKEDMPNKKWRWLRVVKSKYKVIN